MNLVPLVGLSLKDPQIIEILEHYDVDVIYDFDRLVENQPDVYWARLYSQGLLFRFDASQRLDTIFVYVRSTNEYAAHSYKELDFEIFRNLAEARKFAESKHLKYAIGSGAVGVPEWIRIARPTCYVHYQFGPEGLSLVTIMSPQSAPGGA